MNYKEAIDFLNSKINFGSKPGLKRITKLMELVGNPHKNINYIHIAGTNGKGSVSFMLASILKKSGYKTGLYISPAIDDVREKIQMNGNFISEKDFAEIVSILEPAVNNKVFKDDPITEFEFSTAVAFSYFKKENCDIAIVETGMGGKWDATNIIQNPICSVITSISKDHTQILGDTIEKIAYEKLGIIKPFCPVIISANQKKEVYDIANKIAKEINSDIFVADTGVLKNVNISLDNGIQCKYKDLKINLNTCGKYQIENISTVCKVLTIIKEKLHIDKKSVVNGFKNVYLPCRTEVIHKVSPRIILDAAHNISGIEKLKEFIKDNFKKEDLIGVVGIFKDKDFEHMLKEIAPCFEKVFTVEPNSPRKLPLKDITECVLKYNKNSSAEKSVEKAIKSAMESANKSSTIIVFGSFSIMKEAREATKKLF
ncbi:MAG: bifunctional folylpolyglutamate synthase/dihydrofolate synthase [Clostridia bacterium]|nr:bifunctional folylpolyglutamate synthase/dihydrofolate synthase [Clostridia bacterium]